MRRPWGVWLVVGSMSLWAAGMGRVGVGAAEGQPAGKPWWEGSQAGISDQVLPPWTPVEAADGLVKVWGREYRFEGPLPLPTAVQTRGKPVLAGPIGLRGKAADQELQWTGGPCRLMEARPSAAKLTGRAESAHLECQGTIRVEYDGMIRCDLELRPKQGPAVVQELVLEMPIPAEHAKYFHFYPGRWGSSYNSRALPAEGYKSEFKPFFWLGDEWRGLSWFSESDEHFYNPKGVPPIQIVRRSGQVVFRVLLITEAWKMAEPVRYTFGFQATPVKPDRPDAWDFRTVHMGSYQVDEAFLDRLVQAGVRTMCFHEHWTDIQAYPATTHGAELRRLAEACKKRNIQLLLYLGYEMSTIAPEWEAYHEECLVAPRAGGYKRTYQPQPDQTAYIVCYRSKWQDFLAAHLEKLLKEYPISGVYLDGTANPWGCRNTKHGCGYKRPDGSVGTTYPIFSTRSMMKRIYTLVRQYVPDGQVNVHQSTCMTIPTLAFATSYWDGEQLQSLKRPEKFEQIMEILPLDAFRAEFMGKNWGVPAELLHYASGPFQRSEAMALALLHDVPVRPSSMKDLEELSKIWKLWDQLGRHEADWIPYWAEDNRIKTSRPEIKVSLYNRPGRGLAAVVVNTSGQQVQAEVELNLAGLGHPKPLRARNVLTDTEVPFADGRFQTTLPSLGFLLFQAQAP